MVVHVTPKLDQFIGGERTSLVGTLEARRRDVEAREHLKVALANVQRPVVVGAKCIVALVPLALK